MNVASLNFLILSVIDFTQKIMILEQKIIMSSIPKLKETSTGSKSSHKHKNASPKQSVCADRQ